MAKKILYATDYSSASKKALQVASHLALVEEALLLIVHVSEAEQYPVGEHFDETPQPNQAELEELKAVVPTNPKVQYEQRLVYGEPGSTEVTKPADVIVDIAKKENVDEIVVGTHGHTGLAHLLMGSIAEKIIRHAPCPVVAVRDKRQC